MVEPNPRNRIKFDKLINCDLSTLSSCGTLAESPKQQPAVYRSLSKNKYRIRTKPREASLVVHDSLDSAENPKSSYNSFNASFFFKIAYKPKLPPISRLNRSIMENSRRLNTGDGDGSGKSFVGRRRKSFLSCGLKNVFK